MADEIKTGTKGTAVIALGYDTADYRALVVDTDGHLQIDVLSVLGGGHVDNTLFGYNDRYSERVLEADAAAGANTQLGTAVPAGEIWVVQNISAWNSISAMTFCYVEAYDGTTYIQLKRTVTVAAGVSVDWTGSVVLKAGDRIRASYLGCTLNDDIYLDIRGYKMKV